MSRLMWTALGAAGGILAYRKWEQVRDRARAQGVVPVARDLGTSALGTVTATVGTVHAALGTVNSARGLVARTGSGGGR